MKKTLRMSVLSVLVLGALAFSAFGAMAMASAPVAVVATPVASATATSTAQKQEVIGTVTAIDATSITLNGTVYTLSAATEIQGAIQAGDTVKLEIVTNADGSVAVYEVAKPDASDSSVDVSSTEPASIDPTSTEVFSLDKLNVVDPTSTIKPVHTEVASPDKSNVVELVSTVEPVHTEVADKNNTASSSDKSGSSPDKGGNNSGNASGQDAGNDPSQP